MLSSAAVARIFAVLHSRRTRGNGHSLWKGDLTSCKKAFLPLEGGSLLEQVPREAGELLALDKCRSYLMNALGNLILTFSVNLL